MKRTQPEPEQQPQQIGAPEDQWADHRPPAPTPAEHNAAFAQKNPVTPSGDLR